MQVLLLTQPACEFCDQAMSLFLRLSAEYALEITERSLLEPDGRAVAERTGVLFAPGVLIDGELVSYGRPSERRLRRLLARRQHGMPA
jgi:glutaredoxin